MTALASLADEIIRGRRLARGDDFAPLLDAPLGELCAQADRIRRELCGNRFDLCSIVNGKSGRCPENCRFCAQSAHHRAGIAEYPFLGEDAIVAECRRNAEQGARRFAIVTAGRSLSGDGFEKALAAFRALRRECPEMKLCASLGLLTDGQFARLRETGVTTVHCNIETSRRFFPEICTTHAFGDKLACIGRARAAGLAVCSGGIVGMGETWEDRIDMALTLAELDIRSVPVNVLRPIAGTPLAGLSGLPADDILRIGALFRFILPAAFIRFAAGRRALPDSGTRAFRSGMNAAITGDMLTTSGNPIPADLLLLSRLGFVT